MESKANERLITEQQRRIVGIVMDDLVLRKIASLKWTVVRAIREEICLTLSQSPVVSSELNLAFEWEMDEDSFRKAMDRGGIPCTDKYHLMEIQLTNFRCKARIDSDGSTGLIFGRGCARIHYSGDAIVRLLLFIDAVLPAVEQMVREKTLEMERDDAALTIAERTLGCRLDALGRPYHVFGHDHVLEVDILLPPDGRLHLTVKEDEVVRVAGLLGTTLDAATSLYDLFGPEINFAHLERWDHWARPYNEKVK